LRKNVVPSEGLTNAKIFICGQALEVEEDKKCLPNHPQTGGQKEEIEACLLYLKKQIEIINPQYFILLGEVAFSVFSQKTTTRPPPSHPLKAGGPLN